MKIDINADEAEAIRAALEHYNAYLRSQKREEAKYLRMEDLFRKLAGSGIQGGIMDERALGETCKTLRNTDSEFESVTATAL